MKIFSSPTTVLDLYRQRIFTVEISQFISDFTLKSTFPEQDDYQTVVNNDKDIYVIAGHSLSHQQYIWACGSDMMTEELFYRHYIINLLCKTSYQILTCVMLIHKNHDNVALVEIKERFTQ